MQIARAFKEEILSSGAENNRTSDVLGNEDVQSVPDYSHFRIPKNTYAIAIDDSKIQRKLLGKFFDFAGISSDQQTIVGDGYNEIVSRELSLLLLVHLDDINFTHRFPYRWGSKISSLISVKTIVMILSF